jgi:hypothetical protein
VTYVTLKVIPVSFPFYTGQDYLWHRFKTKAIVPEEIKNGRTEKRKNQCHVLTGSAPGGASTKLHCGNFHCRITSPEARHVQVQLCPFSAGIYCFKALREIIRICSHLNGTVDRVVNPPFRQPQAGLNLLSQTQLVSRRLIRRGKLLNTKWEHNGGRHITELFCNESQLQATCHGFVIADFHRGWTNSSVFSGYSEAQGGLKLTFRDYLSRLQGSRFFFDTLILEGKPISSPETSVSNRLTQRNDPEDGRIQSWIHFCYL